MAIPGVTRSATTSYYTRPMTKTDRLDTKFHQTSNFTGLPWSILEPTR